VGFINRRVQEFGEVDRRDVVSITGGIDRTINTDLGRKVGKRLSGRVRAEGGNYIEIRHLSGSELDV